MEIISGVHVLKNSFVNLYLILEPEGLTLIDTGMPKAGAKLVLEAIQNLKRKPSDLKRILITHADPDHTGSVHALTAATGASVYASHHDGEKMALGLPGRPGKGFAGILTKYLMPAAAPQTADVFLEDGQELPVLGGLKAIFTPGHTPGHVSFYSSSRKILFAGDSLNTMGGKLQFMAGPFTDDFTAGQNSVRIQAALGAEIVCCGHGTPMKSSLKFPF
jgi:glyoxylase-like metal-dependent hydrolase (beta-lactamase superfamily II)